MSRQFNFQTLPDASHSETEANIFIHGYSAGNDTEDKKTLLASIPE